MSYSTFSADCFEWLQRAEPKSIHAVLTDPPYGIVEFTKRELDKLRAGVGGVWRIPPSIGGSVRKPLPRFTVLSADQRAAVEDFFTEWARLLKPVLVPGAHVLVATNVLLSSKVQSGLENAGLEYRGQLIRLYRGFRGGDRPKGAEEEFPNVSVMMRGAYEPWLLFRNPIEDRLTVADNLRKWGTGALRRPERDKPATDVLVSKRTPQAERAICDHPTLKPQALLRPLVRMLLPLGEGVVLDPFMGSGSTIAAAKALGYSATGIELDEQYFALAQKAIPKLAEISVAGEFDEVQCQLF